MFVFACCLLKTFVDTLIIIHLFHCFKGNIQEYFCSKVSAEGGWKHYISGIPRNQGTNVVVYFQRSNEINVMLHFTRENPLKNRSEILRATQRQLILRRHELHQAYHQVAVISSKAVFFQSGKFQQAI